MFADGGDGFSASFILSSDPKAAMRTKLMKACDNCRRKKVRCDGGGVPGTRCVNCRGTDAVCTYTPPSNTKKWGSKAHIEDLEIRLANADKLLHMLSPDIDLGRVLNDMDSRKGISLIPESPATPDLHPDPASSDEEFEDGCNHVDRQNHIFWGKSSGFKLVQFALDTRNFTTGSYTPFVKESLKLRDEVWGIQEWMKPPTVPLRKVTCSFPEPDLLRHIVDLYFECTNPFTPLLHRPTFEESVADDLHHRDAQFAMVLLLVCAIGVRFSDDRRIPRNLNAPTSPCWVWFYQAQDMRRSTLLKPSLYDLQGYCLSAMFLECASPDTARWNLIGIGLRLAQEVGVHRKFTYGKEPSVQSELWKRAFWVLLTKDRISSAVLGRNCALQEEDYDLELPIECDDEYWEAEDPDMSFKQPPGRPSSVSYFYWYLKLNHILGAVLRRIGSIDKFNSGINHEWDKRRLDRLETEIDTWYASVPEHLVWDPNRENLLHYKQSVLIRTYYCVVLLVAHRPFVFSRRHPKTSARSFATCLDCARECLKIVETALPRLGVTLRLLMGPIFVAGTILLLNMWREKRTSGSEEALKEVQRCMEILSSIENRWHFAGRLRDIMHALVVSNDHLQIKKPFCPPDCDGRSHPGSHSTLPSFEDIPSDPANFPQSSYFDGPRKEHKEEPANKDVIPEQQSYADPLLGLSALSWTDLDRSSMVPPWSQSSDPQQSYREYEKDVFNFLSAAANGNGLDEWNSYLHHVGQMVQGLQGDGSMSLSSFV